jgi:hypothetical protein
MDLKKCFIENCVSRRKDSHLFNVPKSMRQKYIYIARGHCKFSDKTRLFICDKHFDVSIFDSFGIK